jgi:hypothetical protein
MESCDTSSYEGIVSVFVFSTHPLLLVTSPLRIAMLMRAAYVHGGDEAQYVGTTVVQAGGSGHTDAQTGPGGMQVRDIVVPVVCR